MNQILEGDCIQLSKKAQDLSVQCVVCSPPYAMQRQKLYDGISETKYPEWTVKWMRSLKPKLKENGSVFMVIRPNLKRGVISDYVLKTRLAVRKDGWNECEELIWIKSDAPPLGSIKRPRRAWESILWFSMTSEPYCDLRACGNQESTRVGAFAGSDRFGYGGDSPVHAGQNTEFKRGTSRCTDLISVPIGTMDKGVDHPAMYPQGVPDFLIQTFSKPGDLILDPFCGSGQTLLSAKRLGRDYLGYDINSDYVKIAEERIKKAPCGAMPSENCDR